MVSTVDELTEGGPHQNSQSSCQKQKLDNRSSSCLISQCQVWVCRIPHLVKVDISHLAEQTLGSVLCRHSSASAVFLGSSDLEALLHHSWFAREDFRHNPLVVFRWTQFDSVRLEDVFVLDADGQLDVVSASRAHKVGVTQNKQHYQSQDDRYQC